MKALVSWEEFDNMTYGDAKELITGDVYHTRSIVGFLESKGCPPTKGGDNGIYEAYVRFWIIENSPLGQALC